MNGFQLLGVLVFAGLAVWFVHLDRTKWSKMPRRSDQAAPIEAVSLQRPARPARRAGHPDADLWLGDVQAWGDELDGTTTRTQALDDQARGDIYAQAATDRRLWMGETA